MMSRLWCRSIRSPAVIFWNSALSSPRGAFMSISSMMAFCLRLANRNRLISRLLSRSVASRSTSRASRSSKANVAMSGCRCCSSSDTAIHPARPRKPRDKAKVEVAVQIVQRFVLARLRNRRFFSLQELNAAIRETVADLNTKIMRKLGVSRNELFADIDRPALKALPTTPYQYAEWKKCRVAPDYHVEIADHY